MYGPMETALKAALADVIADAPVLGHLDLVDLDKGPSVQIKLSYLGYRPRGRQVRDLASLDQRWVALVLVNAARLDPARQAVVEQGFRTLTERICAFRYDRFTRPELDATPEPGFTGHIVEMGVYFTIAAVSGAKEDPQP